MQTNMKLKEEFVKIKIYSMDGIIYFVEIPYQFYNKDMIDIWIEQNLKNVDYWEYWK